MFMEEWCAPLPDRCSCIRSTVLDAPSMSTNARCDVSCHMSTSLLLPLMSMPSTLSVFFCVMLRVMLSPVMLAADVRSSPMIRLSSPSCTMSRSMPEPLCVMYILLPACVLLRVVFTVVCCEEVMPAVGVGSVVEYAVLGTNATEPVWSQYNLKAAPPPFS